MKLKVDKSIDLRSDTVTLPTEEMLEAIRNAKLGDDVFREDPSVNRLETLAARKMGKEAALLVTSGTQANLVSFLSNTEKGEAVILESESHVFWYEVGGISSIAGLLPIPIEGLNGVLDPKDIEKVLRFLDPKNLHFPKATLISIENTHNRAGGAIITLDQIREISEVAKANNLLLYMDGARIFNAAVALEKDVRDLTRHVDNLMFCLSKGLCCPIGSIVVGSQEFIDRARRMRKILGGGMRQAGIIAAPGIIALEKMIGRLKEDHRNARSLAEGLSRLEGVSVNLETVRTNIVLINIGGLEISSDIFVSKLKKKGVLVLKRDRDNVRLVTHRGIDKEDIEKALEIVENEVRKIRKRGNS